MFDYFNEERFSCEPVDYPTIDVIFEEQRRRCQQLEDYKFKMADVGPPLCEICSLDHPPLRPNKFAIE